MRRWLPLVLFALALAGVARAGDELDAKERQKRLEEARKARADADRRFGERVNESIDKGAKWLAAQQGPDGSWPGLMPGTKMREDLGLQALCLFTLVKCGADASDAVVRKGMKRLNEMHAAPNAVMTYSAATMLLLYDALYGPKDKPAKPGDKPPAAGAAKPGKKGKVPKDVEAVMRELADWFVVNQEENVWRYPAGLGGNQDLSNTQYALLGLQAAARCGVDVRAIVYQKALAYLLEQQAPSGPEVQRLVPNPAYEPGGDDHYGPFLAGPKDHARGWSYLPGTRVDMGGMTAAGLAGLAVVKDRLRAAEKLDKETERKIDRSMLDGMAWLSSRFSVVTNPGSADGGWHYAYLYTLERAGSLMAVTHFGQHDWYREGAELLIEKQLQDGGWPAATTDLNKALEPRHVQSCFALLFLSRATAPPEKPVGPVTTGD